MNYLSTLLNTAVNCFFVAVCLLLSPFALKRLLSLFILAGSILQTGSIDMTRFIDAEPYQAGRTNFYVHVTKTEKTLYVSFRYRLAKNRFRAKFPDESLWCHHRQIAPEEDLSHPFRQPRSTAELGVNERTAATMTERIRQRPNGGLTTDWLNITNVMIRGQLNPIPRS